MKKNIFTVIITAIVLVNLVLTSVLMFVLVPSVKKTDKLVKQVAKVIQLEIETQDGVEDENKVSVLDSEVISITSPLTINLKSSGSSKTYAILDGVSIYLNKKDKSYKKLQPTVEENKSIILEIVTNVFSKYSVDEAQNNRDALKTEILNSIQSYFDSEFIYNVSFENLRFQS